MQVCRQLLANHVKVSFVFFSHFSVMEVKQCNFSYSIQNLAIVDIQTTPNGSIEA